MRYSDSGVDIDAGNKLTARIRRLAAGTHNASVLGGIGGFAAVYEMPTKFRAPLLVSATDGVGTKLKLAMQLARHDSVGIDLVAMCVNDIIVHGAEPLYFLDYFASGKLDVAQAEAVIGGIARGCEIANCALAGGETAEMPGFYARGEYDLAGFAVGAVDKENLITPARVAVGDVVLGLASSGAHANGFSLIRKVLEVSGDDLAMAFGESTLGDALIAPTKIYVRSLLRLFDEVQVSALAHITGGGLLENPPRVLPDGTNVEIHRSAWEMPAVFDWLQRNGEIDDEEMLRTFNCGIGMLVLVRAADVGKATKVLTDAGETVFTLGEVCAGGDKDENPMVKICD